jgi:hypothetical protein
MNKPTDDNDKVKIKPGKKFQFLLLILLIGLIFATIYFYEPFRQKISLNLLENTIPTSTIEVKSKESALGCPEQKTVEVCSNHDTYYLKIIYSYLKLKNAINDGSDYIEQLVDFKNSVADRTDFADELQKLETYKYTNISTKMHIESDFERIIYDLLSEENHNVSGKGYKGVLENFFGKFIRVRSTKLAQSGETYSADNKVELIYRALKNDDYIAALAGINLLSPATYSKHQDVLAPAKARGELEETLGNIEIKLDELINNKK